MTTKYHLKLMKKMQIIMVDTEKQAEQFAETTPQGQRLAFLKALSESAKDKVKEASVSDELKDTLDNLFKMVGVAWERKLPALPRK